MKIAPSMLACDFAQMGRDIVRVSEGGADYIHLDVMDGCFVPNISFGPAVIHAMRKYTSVPFDVHLMIDTPHRYIADYIAAGANHITFHVEAEPQVEQTIAAITAGGATAGLSVKPSTPAEAVFPYLDKLFMVLVMTVEPGFGGQSFMQDMMEKVKAIKAEAKRRGIDCLVEVDGGINAATVRTAAQAGVDICVAGTGVFAAQDCAAAIAQLKELALG